MVEREYGQREEGEGELAAGPPPPSPSSLRHSLNIHRKEGIEIGCNRI